MMNKLLFCLCASWFFFQSLWAGEPLRRPLVFVPSDSVVVWGEDRSDFRNTALAVAPQLFARSVKVGELSKRQIKKASTAWEKELLPSLDVTGAVVDAQQRPDLLSTSDMIYQSARLFLSTADAQYMNMIERTSLNALMNILLPGELSFEKHVAAQAMMNVSGMIYATDAEGIYVNLYINNSTHILTDYWDLVIDQLTAMPHSGRVKLRIGGRIKGLEPMKLRLRMPDWAYGNLPEHYGFSLIGTPDRLPVIYVNGREESYQLEQGYLVIDRQWNSGDEVFFDFPFHLQKIQAHGQHSSVKVQAMQRGPLLYGFMHSTQNFTKSFSEEITESSTPNAYGHSVMVVPIKQPDGKKFLREAQPYMDGAKYLWMNVTK